MREFTYKCVVAKNGSKMYYKRVKNKWKRISNSLGMKAEKGKRKYMNGSPKEKCEENRYMKWENNKCVEKTREEIWEGCLKSMGNLKDDDVRRVLFKACLKNIKHKKTIWINAKMRQENDVDILDVYNNDGDVIDTYETGYYDAIIYDRWVLCNGEGERDHQETEWLDDSLKELIEENILSNKYEAWKYKHGGNNTIIINEKIKLKPDEKKYLEKYFNKIYVYDDGNELSDESTDED